MSGNTSPIRGSDLGFKMTRRELFIGAAGLAGAGALLAACGGDKAVGPLSFGARTVDESPTKQLKALVAAGFVLFLLTLIVNMIASSIVTRTTKSV